MKDKIINKIIELTGKKLIKWKNVDNNSDNCYLSFLGTIILEEDNTLSIEVCISKSIFYNTITIYSSKLEENSKNGKLFYETYPDDQISNLLDAINLSRDIQNENKFKSEILNKFLEL